MPGSSLTPLNRLLITTFGLGHMRPASGTWGSLPPVAIAGGMILLGWHPLGSGLVATIGYHAVLLAIVALFAHVCVHSGDAAEAAFGKKDPGQIVADETVGQCLPLMFLPAFATHSLHHLVFTLALAFVAFRICDIIKPWPARGLQEVPGGWGVLLDDVVAGVQAAAITQIVLLAVF